MKRILSVSCDKSLLESREHLLKHSGVAVTSALGVLNALKACEQGDFDLLLLGHSIGQEDQAKLIRNFRKSCSGPILAMHRSFDRPVKDSDYHFDAGRPPAELLELVSAILSCKAKRESPS